MVIRPALLAALGLIVSGCAVNGGGPSTAFEVVDSNDDGQVDIGEFRRQNLFPPYEQFFYEANTDGDDTLDPDEFHVAESNVYNAMGVGGVDI